MTTAGAVDSSVVMRVVLNAPERLGDLASFDEVIASELLRVECLRTLDRLRLKGALTDRDVARYRVQVRELLERIDLIPMTAPVLDRASEPFPTLVATLDAIHLASALLWQQSEGVRLDSFMTHDEQLGRAARACGLRVLGCQP